MSSYTIPGDSGDSKLRHINLNGIDFVVQCHDPYGFWTVRPMTSVEKLPVEITGYFTDYDNAITAANKVLPSQLVAKSSQPKVLAAKVRNTNNE